MNDAFDDFFSVIVLKYQASQLGSIQLPDFRRIPGPNSLTRRESASEPLLTTWRAMTSASTIVIPIEAKRSLIVVFPEPMPPVKPTINTLIAWRKKLKVIVLDCVAPDKCYPPGDCEVRAEGDGFIFILACENDAECAE